MHIEVDLTLDVGDVDGKIELPALENDDFD